MKPFFKFIFSHFFDAYNISKAEENSANENSLIIYASSSLFKKFLFFFGIKNIFIYLIFIFFFSTSLIADNRSCYKIPPFGFNGFYVHLPINYSFCVKNGKEIINYTTGSFGERILSNNKKNKHILVFGDSHALGLDVNSVNQYFLGKIFNNDNFKLFAAPNNGPYQVLEFLKIHGKKIENNSEINVVFNGSTDLFRLDLKWTPKKIVLFNDNELEDIKDSKILYNYKLFKGFLTNKFTYKRPNTERMQSLFIKNFANINENFSTYLIQLNKLKFQKKNLYIILPFWIFEKEKNNFKKNDLVYENFFKLVCSIDATKNNTLNILVQIDDIDISKNFLIYDKRHFQSKLINLTTLNNFCSF